MIESAQDLNDPHNSSLKSPGTPEFSLIEPGCQDIDFSFRLEKGSDDENIKPFTYEHDFSFQDPEIPEGLPMENHCEDGHNPPINKTMPISIDVDDAEFEPIISRSFIIVNHIEKRDKPSTSFQSLMALIDERIETQSQSSSQSIQKNSIKRDRINMLFLDSQISQSLPEERSKGRQLWFNEQNDPVCDISKNLSFIIKNEVEKETISTKNSFQSQNKEQDGKMNENLQIKNCFQINPIKNAQLEINQHEDQQADPSKQMMGNEIEQHAQDKEKVSQDSNADQAGSLKYLLSSIGQKKLLTQEQKFQSSDDKQNQPLDRSQQRSELSTIPEENSTNINQSEAQELAVNVIDDESMFIHSSISEKQEEMIENGPKQRYQVEKNPPKIRKKPPSFWEVKIIEQTTLDKRQRRRPCQYWIGENIRCLKDNQVKTCYRRQFQEVFLKLNHPSEIQDAATLFTQGNLMKGSLTMRPRSKINVNTIEGIFTVKSSQRKVYFTFNQNQVLISKSKGQNKLYLTNPQIHSIRNSLNQNCNIIVTIQQIP